MANATNTVDYQFDGAGRRTVVWQESNNLSIRGNVYWGSTPIALHGINGTEYFEQQDWLGTERVRTDYTGAVVGSYVSLAFGDGFSASGTDEDPYHFAGTDRDSESATDHAQFRQFREATGRWMSPDPYDGSYDWSDPQSLNRYAYVLNNPLTFIDPLGLWCNPDPDSNGVYQCGTGPAPLDPVTLLPGGPPSGGSGGGGGGAAPSNVPRTPAQCAGQALKNNAVSLAFDAAGVGAGFLPGGDAVVAIAQIGVGVGSTVNSALSANTTTAEGQRATGGAIGSIFGIQLAALAPAAKYAGVGAKAVPVLGALVSLAGGLNDLYQTGADYQACLAGH